MNEERLLGSFSFLDEELIERSERRTARAVHYKWATAAACLVLLAGAVFALRGLWLPPRPEKVQAEPCAAAETPARVQEEPDKPEPAEPEPDAPVSNGAALMLPDNSGEVRVMPMIEAFETDGDACYAAPQNGEAGFSVPLRAAMAAYGESAAYRVWVDLFRDGELLAPDSPEAEAERERLAALGYIVAYEVYDDGQTEHPRFTLHAKLDQLQSFPAGGYGYMLFLYGERVEGAGQEPAVNGGAAVFEVSGAAGLVTAEP